MNIIEYVIQFNSLIGSEEVNKCSVHYRVRVLEIAVAL